MPADPGYALVLALFPEIAGIITSRGALTGGGGPVLSAINAIFGLPEVASRSQAGWLYSYVRQAMLAGQGQFLGTLTPAQAFAQAPSNPELFTGLPGTATVEYRVVVTYHDPFTGMQQTAAVDVPALGPLGLSAIETAAFLAVVDDYQVSPEDVQFLAPELTEIISIQHL